MARPTAAPLVPACTRATTRAPRRPSTQKFAHASAPPAAAASMPRAPQTRPATLVAATARTRFARSIRARAALLISSSALVAPVLPHHAHQRLDRGADAGQ